MNFNMKKMVFTLLAIAIAVQGGILGHQAAVGYFCLMVIINPHCNPNRIDNNH